MQENKSILTDGKLSVEVYDWYKAHSDGHNETGLYFSQYLRSKYNMDDLPNVFNIKSAVDATSILYKHFDNK